MTHFALKFSLTATLWALLNISAPTTSYAQAETSDLTYIWTDSSGAEHTSGIYEKATDTEQMKWLVITVFTNKEIPGTKQVIRNEQQELFTLSYNINTSTKDNTTGLTIAQAYGAYGLASGSYIPNEDGLTALLVEFKDDYQGNQIKTFDGAWNVIKSIQVLAPERKEYIDDGDKKGYLLNINQPLNKFFIMLKGNPLYSGGYMFFKYMYEQLSPSLQSNECINAYSKMAEGEKFPVAHNCGSVICNAHPTMMFDKGSTEPRQANLLVFIPDNRFIDSRNYVASGLEFNVYNTSYQPYFYFYTINLETPEITSSDGQNYCDVTLEWHSSQKDITQDVTEEEFVVWRRVDGGAWSRVPAADITVSQDGTAITGNDNMPEITRSLDGDVKITVKETVATDGKNIEYKVDGRMSGSNFDYVESNTQKIYIPGYTENTDITVRISLEHKSQFDISELSNHYTNTVNVLQKTDNPLLCSHIGENTAMYLRYYVDPQAGTDDDSVIDIDHGTLLATITIAPADENGIFTATAVWADGTGDTDTFSLREAEDGNGELVAATQDDNLFSLVHRFEVSTAEASDNSRYVYRLFATGLEHTTQGDDGANLFPSNTAEVSIPAAGLEASAVTYTLDEIKSDIDRHLPASTPALLMTLPNEPSIDVLEVTTHDMDMAAKAFRGQGGEYSFNTYTDNNATSLEEMTTEPNFYGTVKLPVGTERGGAQLVMTVVCKNGNTYGSPVVVLPVMPQIEINGVTMKYTDGQYEVDGRWDISGGVNDDDYSHIGFGAWRDIIHGEISDISGITELAYHRFSDGENQITLTDAYNKADGAQGLESNSVFFNDHFVAEMGTPAAPAPLWYVVRHYSKFADTADEEYLIAETAGNWSHNGTSTITGVENLIYLPAQDTVTIADGIATVTGDAPVTIIDIYGNTVLSADGSTSSRTIDLRVLQPGIYIVITNNTATKIRL